MLSWQQSSSWSSLVWPCLLVFHNNCSLRTLKKGDLHSQLEQPSRALITRLYLSAGFSLKSQMPVCVCQCVCMCVSVYCFRLRRPLRCLIPILRGSWIFPCKPKSLLPSSSPTHTHTHTYIYTNVMHTHKSLSHTLPSWPSVLPRKPYVWSSTRPSYITEPAVRKQGSSFWEEMLRVCAERNWSQHLTLKIVHFHT